MKLFQKTKNGSDLIKKALIDINSEKFFAETNQALLEAIITYIATSNERLNLVKALENHVKFLKMDDSWRIQRLIKDAKDDQYCDTIKKHPKFANYSFNTFKAAIDVALRNNDTHRNSHTFETFSIRKS